MRPGEFCFFERAPDCFFLLPGHLCLRIYIHLIGNKLVIFTISQYWLPPHDPPKSFQVSKILSSHFSHLLEKIIDFPNSIYAPSVAGKLVKKLDVPITPSESQMAVCFSLRSSSPLAKNKYFSFPSDSCFEKTPTLLSSFFHIRFIFWSKNLTPHCSFKFYPLSYFLRMEKSPNAPETYSTPYCRISNLSMSTPLSNIKSFNVYQSAESFNAYRSALLILLFTNTTSFFFLSHFFLQQRQTRQATLHSQSRKHLT